MKIPRRFPHSSNPSKLDDSVQALRPEYGQELVLLPLLPISGTVLQNFIPCIRMDSPPTTHDTLFNAKSLYMAAGCPLHILPLQRSISFSKSLAFPLLTLHFSVSE